MSDRELDRREVEWPPPSDDPAVEPVEPWARRHGPVFDWEAERERQSRGGPRWLEPEEERHEREASIRPYREGDEWR